MESSINGAVTLSHMNFAGYDCSSWMSSVASRSVEGLGFDYICSGWSVVMHMYL